MYQIEINDAQSRLQVDLERIRRVAADVLKHEGVASAEISIALIDGASMQQLNREHLGHDYDTDVLSFLLDCRGPVDAETGLPRGRGKTVDGEVLISTDTADRVAEEFRWSAESEVILYLVHGLLHLVGYDDLVESEQATMRQRERVHLARWDLEPVYADTDATPSSEHSLSVRG